MWCPLKPSACLHHPGPGVYSNDGSSPAAAPAHPTLCWGTSVGSPKSHGPVLAHGPAVAANWYSCFPGFSVLLSSSVSGYFPKYINFGFPKHSLIWLFPAHTSNISSFPILLLHPPSFAFDCLGQITVKADMSQDVYPGSLPAILQRNHPGHKILPLTSHSDKPWVSK